MGGGGRGGDTGPREGSPREGEAGSRWTPGCSRGRAVQGGRLTDAGGAQAFGASRAIGTRFITLALTSEQTPCGSPRKLQ